MRRASSGKGKAHTALAVLTAAGLAALVGASPAAAGKGSGGGGSKAYGGTQFVQKGTSPARGDAHGSPDKGNSGGDDGKASRGGSSDGLAWPVPSHLVLSPFGENRGDHYHSGIDINAPIGTPVRAAAAGTVIWVGPEGGYGNFVCIAHSALSTCYAHLSQFMVSAGQSVRQGDTIGLSGCTGNCSGPHLHFEVRTGTRMWATAVNPLSYLPGGASIRPNGVAREASAVAQQD